MVKEGICGVMEDPAAREPKFGLRAGSTGQRFKANRWRIALVTAGTSISNILENSLSVSLEINYGNYPIRAHACGNFGCPRLTRRPGAGQRAGKPSLALSLGADANTAMHTIEEMLQEFRLFVRRVLRDTGAS
jgi:hypothetical protein